MEKYMGPMTGPVVNLANSMIGVSILTIPYCFQQCGVVCGFVLLIASSLLTRASCILVIKAGYNAQKFTYGTLACTTYGKLGKLVVELCITGLNAGTLVAFFVIVGDLIPPLVVMWAPHFFSPDTSYSYVRVVVLVVLGVCVAFPLSLIRDVKNMSAVSLLSLVSYPILILRLLLLMLKTDYAGTTVALWNWNGIIPCLPIFLLAYTCHTQLFGIHGTLQDPSVHKMTTVINRSLTSVGVVYALVAIFGYLSFCNVEVRGDILANLPSDYFSTLTRVGFATSVLVTFPLLVFPCRNCIHSLLFSKAQVDVSFPEPIPQGKFVLITSALVGGALLVAIYIPNVELVLALMGSTMGVLISFVCPGFMFVAAAQHSVVQHSPTSHVTRAKSLVVFGVVVMVLGTGVAVSSIGLDSAPEPPPDAAVSRWTGMIQTAPFGGGMKLHDPKDYEAFVKNKDSVFKKEMESDMQEVKERLSKVEEENKVLKENLTLLKKESGAQEKEKEKPKEDTDGGGGGRQAGQEPVARDAAMPVLNEPDSLAVHNSDVPTTNPLQSDNLLGKHKEADNEQPPQQEHKEPVGLADKRLPQHEAVGLADEQLPQQEHKEPVGLADKRLPQHEAVGLADEQLPQQEHKEPVGLADKRLPQHEAVGLADEQLPQQEHKEAIALADKRLPHKDEQ